MFQEIFIYILSWVILLLPLVVWLFIFSEFHISRRILLFGLSLWALISVILAKFWYLLTFVFQSLHDIWDSFFWIAFFLNLVILFIVPFGVAYMLSKFSKKYVWVMGIFFLCVCIISCLVYFSTLYFTSQISNSIQFWILVFSTLGGIIWYYLTISILEEGSKLLGVLNTNNFSLWNSSLFLILSWVIVSLWFSLSENILYVYFYSISQSVGFDLISISFFRSVFALSLHISAGLLAVYGVKYILNNNSSSWTHVYTYIVTYTHVLSCDFFDV